MSVSENLRQLKGSLPQGIILVAVSKTKPTELIVEAYNTGHRDFGENYVQELTEKYNALPKDIRWHFIGHLQSNKVKYIAPFVHLIHGVDSTKLLAEINKQGKKLNRVINCLLQIYIAKEESKFGFDFNEAKHLISSDAFMAMEHVKIIGLMGMATNTSNLTLVNDEFSSLSEFARELKSDFGSKANFEVKEISMGMSSDYQLAIENGSTMLRIGSSIFGSR